MYQRMTWSSLKYTGLLDKNQIAFAGSLQLTQLVIDECS